MTREERGSGTLLVAVAVVLLAVVAAVLLLVGAALTGIRQVRSASDLVAVSAASAQANGEPPCVAAARMAEANHVELRDCQAAGDLIDFVVTVTIAAPADSLPGKFGFTTRSHAGWVSS